MARFPGSIATELGGSISSPYPAVLRYSSSAERYVLSLCFGEEKIPVERNSPTAKMREFKVDFHTVSICHFSRFAPPSVFDRGGVVQKRAMTINHKGDFNAIYKSSPPPIFRRRCWNHWPGCQNRAPHWLPIIMLKLPKTLIPHIFLGGRRENILYTRLSLATWQPEEVNID